MKKLIKGLIFVILNFCYLLMSGQSTQTESFVDQSSRSVAKFTGRFEKSIPLCSVSKRGLGVNVGIHYSSEGFKVHKRTSEVGHNWTLNYSGGAITRIVNGIEDEFNDPRETFEDFDADKDDLSKIYRDGYLVGIRKHKPTLEELKVAGNGGNSVDHPNGLPTIVKDRVYREARNRLAQVPIGGIGRVTKIYPYIGPENDSYELEPDEFRFNFHGISGSFFFDHNGVPKVTSSGTQHLKVEEYQPLVRENTDQTDRIPTISSFVITADNGYKYYFGGDFKAMEWSYNRNNRAGNEYGGRAITNAWNLTRVETPNGESLVYNYQPLAPNWNQSFFPPGTFNQGSLPFEYKRPNGSFLGRNAYDYGVVNDVLGNVIATHYTECRHRDETEVPLYVEKKSIIQSIIIQERNYNNVAEIDFEYEAAAFNASSLRDIAFETKKLSRIHVSGTNLPDKTVNFTHGIFGGEGAQRLFLESVRINNQEPYSFEYRDTEKLPKYRSFERDKNDFWIKWKNNQLNNFRYGNRYYDRSEPLESRRRKTCFFKYDDNTGELVPLIAGVISDDIAETILTGLLNKIILPTKGAVEIEYKSVYKCNKQEPVVVTEITNSTTLDQLTTKYIYPRYGMVYSFPRELEPKYTREDFTGSCNNIGPSTWRYNTVIEVLPNNSKILSVFNSVNKRAPSTSRFGSYRDPIVDFGQVFDEFWEDPLIRPLLYASFQPGSIGAESPNRYGYIKEEYHIGANNKLTSKKEFSYTNDLGSKEVLGYRIVGESGEKYRYGPKSYFPQISEVKTFVWNKQYSIYEEELFGAELLASNTTEEERFDRSWECVGSISNVRYNETYNKPIEVTTTTPGKPTIIKRITYPFDYSLSNPIYDLMVSENQLFPISETTEMILNGRTVPLSSNIIEYVFEGGRAVPKKSYNWSYKGNFVTTNPLTINTDGVVTVGAPNNTVITDYKSFTNYGVPTETSDNLNNKTVVMLDRERRGVVQFGNISLSELQSIPAQGAIATQNMASSNYDTYYDYCTALFTKAFTGSNSPLILSEFNNLRAYLSTHYPLASFSLTSYNNIGLVDYTIDGRGLKTSFTYDDRHRLITTKDFEGNIVSHTNYNTKQ